MAIRTFLTDPIPEKATAIYQAKLVDAFDVAIPATGLSSLALTLYTLDDPALQIVNSRDHQNVLNANGVTLDGQGKLVWTITVDDTIVRDQQRSQERLLALFEWNGLTVGVGKHEVVLTIQQLKKVAD